MKKFGICLMIAGAFWGVIAFSMKTSIEIPITSSLWSVYNPNAGIHNLALADQRRNHLMGAGITLISGILLFCFGTMQATKETLQTNNTSTSAADNANIKCPFCAETIKQEAVICRFCNRDVPQQTPPSIELSAAETYFKTIKDEDKTTFEKYTQMSEKERRDSCFACRGADSSCGMCDFRESNLKKYLEAKKSTITVTT